MKLNRVIVLGGSGLLGSCFKHIFKDKVIRVGRNKSNDIVINKDIINTLDSITQRNDLIVNASWDIRLREWENNLKLSREFKIFSEKIFQFCKRKNISSIFISSDQVYKGKGPHNELENPLPLNKYGLAKLDCEKIALFYGASVARLNFISRDPLHKGRGWLENLVSNSTQGKKITLFDNIFFSPCSGISAVNLISKIAMLKTNDIFNIGGKDRFSKAHLSKRILDRLNIKNASIIIKSVEEFPDGIPREKDLSMDSKKIAKELNIELESINETLDNSLFS